MTDMEINTETTDDELADLIRANFTIRDLVAIWYDDEDGKQWMIKGGLDVMGRQHIYIRGLTSSGTVAVQIIKMSMIQDIQLFPEQTDPYKVEEEIEERLLQMKWGRNNAEEATLMALKAAGEKTDAEVTEGRAAFIREVQSQIWDEDEGAFDQERAAWIEQASAQDAEEDGLIHCNQCEAVFARTMAYWVHLDDHDMQTLGAMA